MKFVSIVAMLFAATAVIAQERIPSLIANDSETSAMFESWPVELKSNPEFSDAHLRDCETELRMLRNVKSCDPVSAMLLASAEPYIAHNLGISKEDALDNLRASGPSGSQHLRERILADKTLARALPASAFSSEYFDEANLDTCREVTLVLKRDLRVCSPESILALLITFPNVANLTKISRSWALNKLIDENPSLKSTGSEHVQEKIFSDKAVMQLVSRLSPVVAPPGSFQELALEHCKVALLVGDDDLVQARCSPASAYSVVAVLPELQEATSKNRAFALAGLQALPSKELQRLGTQVDAIDNGIVLDSDTAKAIANFETEARITH